LRSELPFGKGELDVVVSTRHEAGVHAMRNALTVQLRQEHMRLAPHKVTKLVNLHTALNRGRTARYGVSPRTKRVPLRSARACKTLRWSTRGS